jgi:hypothetical protein
MMAVAIIIRSQDHGDDQEDLLKERLYANQLASRLFELMCVSSNIIAVHPIRFQKQPVKLNHHG